MINCDGRVAAVCMTCGLYSPCLTHGVIHIATTHMYGSVLITPLDDAQQRKCLACLLQDTERYDMVIDQAAGVIHREVWVGATKHRF